MRVAPFVGAAIAVCGVSLYFLAPYEESVADWVDKQAQNYGEAPVRAIMAFTVLVAFAAIWFTLRFGIQILDGDRIQ